MSDLELLFISEWHKLNPYQWEGMYPCVEYRFDKMRRWRFDFAWPEYMLACECEGGVFSRGRHTRGKGYEGDLAKYNAATLQGWRVLRYTAGMLKSDPQGVIDEIVQALGGN